MSYDGKPPTRNRARKPDACALCTYRLPLPPVGPMVGADGRELTLDEEVVVAALEWLAKKWPKSLWLFSANSELHVMRCGPDGQHVVRNDGMDPDYTVATIAGIPNDGGDW